MLAHELHDNIAQALTGCYMQVTASTNFIEQENGKQIAEEARGSLKDIIKDVRLLSHSLATGMVERRDLHDAIQAELTRIENFSQIACTLTSSSIHEFGTEQKLLLFRIVQEALQNVIKHAQAKNINVVISDSDQDYQLTIRDDGIGFDADATSKKITLGLASMKERVEMLKGALNITSFPSVGTTIDIQIPKTLRNGKDTDSHRR
jgi:signal transduction histidine kinase